MTLVTKSTNMKKEQGQLKNGWTKKWLSRKITSRKFLEKAFLLTTSTAVAKYIDGARCNCSITCNLKKTS